MSLTELGEQLRHARELRGLSLRDLEQATRIRVKYLRALEEGDLNVLSTEVQIRGFLRNYALHVGLDPESALRRLQPGEAKRLLWLAATLAAAPASTSNLAAT